MDQRLYFVVEIDGRGFVFENIGHAASFMADAAEHARRGRYYSSRSEVTMKAVNMEGLRFMYPDEYKEEDVADEATTCTNADQTEE